MAIVKGSESIQVTQVSSCFRLEGFFGSNNKEEWSFVIHFSDNLIDKDGNIIKQTIDKPFIDSFINLSKTEPTLVLALQTYIDKINQLRVSSNLEGQTT